MKKACLTIIAVCLAAGAATASDWAWGPRLGYTHDTGLDQFHLGAHAVRPNLTTNLHLVPSVELGFGDGTLLAVNGDVVWEFTEMATGRWSFYAGGGPVFSHYSNDGFDSTDFALGLVAGATAESGPDRKFFGEVRLGLEDAPGLKITAGLTFF